MSSTKSKARAKAKPKRKAVKKDERKEGEEYKQIVIAKCTDHSIFPFHYDVHYVPRTAALEVVLDDLERIATRLNAQQKDGYICFSQTWLPKSAVDGMMAARKMFQGQLKCLTPPLWRGTNDNHHMVKEDHLNLLDMDDVDDEELGTSKWTWDEFVNCFWDK